MDLENTAEKDEIELGRCFLSDDGVDEDDYDDDDDLWTLYSW